MHWKPKRLCAGVLLAYTVITTALYSVGRCQPATRSAQTPSHLALHTDRSRAFTIGGLDPRWSRGGRERAYLRSTPPRSHYLQNRGRTRAEASEERLRPRMAATAPDKSLREGAKLKQTELRHASFQPARGGCSKGNIEPVTRGKFYITGHLETSSPHVDYQSDSAASGQERVGGQWRAGGSEGSWQRLQPAVQCGDAAMTLSVRRRPATQLLLQRVNESSVPLLQVPPQCGYSVQATGRDLSLVAQYDACHVRQEGGSYVLPLLWRGTPVQMSCPASQSQAQTPHHPPPPPYPLLPPPSLCCSPFGMTISIQGLAAAEQLRVNVRGEWTSAAVLAEQCGYTLDRRGAGLVITAPFITCGITFKDGKYTLFLQMGEQTFTLSCPVTPTEELPVTQEPQPVPWAPPFHLAPLYYPHPTFHQQHLKQQEPHASDPPAPLSPAPKPVFSPQHLPPAGSQEDYQRYSSHQIPAGESHEQIQGFLPHTGHPEDLHSDLHQKEVPPGLGLSDKHRAANSPSIDVFPTQPGALPLPPFSHASIQYYHYYHHPKIPLPEIPQDPDASPDLPPSTKPNSPDVPVLPRSYHQSPGGEDFSLPVPEAFSQPQTLPTGAPLSPYHPQLHPQHYLPHLPHTARGEAKRFAPLDPTASAKPRLSASQNTKPSPLDGLLARPSDGYGSHPHSGESNPSEMAERNSQEWMKHSLLSDGEEAELKPPGSEAVSSPPPSPKHNLPPPAYYYHYYYPFYQMHFGPERPPASSKGAVEPLRPSSSSPPPTSSTGKPLTPSTVHRDPLHPLYYYYYYYLPLYPQPAVPVGEEEAGHRGSTGSESQSPLLSDSDPKRTGWLLLPPDGYPSMHPTDQLFGIYFPDLTQDNPHEAYEREGKEARLDSEMNGHLGTNLCHPLCGFGHVSGPDCSLPTGCCLYPVQGCLEQSSALTASEPPPAHPSQLDAQEPANRLKLGCSSSTGEVSLHGLDQPPEPAVINVQLRIATDASFTSFHPEARRPLADLRGRPVYVELRLLGPPGPRLVLLLHSCLAYTRTPYTSGMLVYDGCSSHVESELLPSPHPDRIRRIRISSFLPLPSESPAHHAEEPEIFFTCLTEVCSAADRDCTLGCVDQSQL